MTQEERRDLTRKARRKIHDAIPGCVAVVDHGEYVGAYVYPEDVSEAKGIIEKGEWEGLTVRVKVAPNILGALAITPIVPK